MDYRKLSAMSRCSILFLLAALLLPAQEKPVETKPASAPDAGPEAVVQKLFDAMAARDALAAKDLFLPDAGLFSLNTAGKANRMPLSTSSTPSAQAKQSGKSASGTPTCWCTAPLPWYGRPMTSTTTAPSVIAATILSAW